MPERQKALENWLETHLPGRVQAITPASSDASFRRYFRVHLADESLIAMDAPPEHEDCVPFVEIAQLIREAGVQAPEILAQDLNDGFLLLTDFGSSDYLSVLEHASVEALYGDALDALFAMQTRIVPQPSLPPYDEALLERELLLFPQWFLQLHLDLPIEEELDQLLAESFQLLIDAALEQPRVFVHRDYHSRNLMHLEQRRAGGLGTPGVLDFQDAVYGPITYDLVSLLKDCYVDWPRELVEEWAATYHERLYTIGLTDCEPQQWMRWFDLMGAQRHIKVLGIFARLYHRDGKEGYLKDLPRVLNYLIEVSELYEELEPLRRIIKEQHLLERLLTWEA